MNRLFLYLTILFSLSSLQVQANEREKQKASALPQKKNEYYQAPDLNECFEKIVSGKEYVIIPKGVILYTPPRLKNKVTSSTQGAKAVSWERFSRRNRNIIHLLALTQSQAMGARGGKRYEIPYKKFEDLKKLGRIIICTYNNAPIPAHVEPKPTK